MGSFSLRSARSTDLEAIERIYDHYVATSTCTAQLEPGGMDARRAWFESHGPRHPVVVAEESGAVIGWGSLSRYKERAGYDATVEDSVYVAAGHQRRGVGSAILGHLVERARDLGHHVVVAGMSGDQHPSMALHARHGFVEVGRLREVIRKFGAWIDLVTMQRGP